MHPKSFARLFIQAEHALLAGDFAALERVVGVCHPIIELAVGHIDAAICHGGTGIAAAERFAPAILGTVLGERIHDALLAPHAIALRAEPLRPIIGTQVGNGRHKK